MTYIATFYSHFGAIRYKRLCGERGWGAQVMPVPRNLSSSCGTCVRYQGPEGEFCPCEKLPEEVEQIVREEGAGYVLLYRAEGS